MGRLQLKWAESMFQLVLMKSKKEKSKLGRRRRGCDPVSGGRESREMIQFVLLISRQGKVRLTKWYSPYSQKERNKVCELDLIFNFHKAYFILDELLIAGELQESSKKTVARLIAAQDSLVETAKEEASSLSNIIAQATNGWINRF
ncbi:AP-1 complex subunit sigma-2, partial [Mucuna pruriens]